MTLRIFCTGLFLLIAFCCADRVYAQERPDPEQSSPAAESISDSTQIVANDSTEQEVKKGPIETTIDYSSADSMKFDIFTQTMFLYGNAEVTYGRQKINAAIIELNMAKTLVKAYGFVDSTSTLIGTPVFQDGDVTYNAEEITYNYESKKGLISRIITEQNEGFIQGERVKKTPDNELFLRDAIYTTCNLTEPHFGIRARQLKLVPNKYVIAGPFNMELNGVPTPLGFALGLFPFTSKRSSGILMPTYGESVDRGFFLRNGGVYLALNDYLDAKITGEIYSLGGWGLQYDTRYKKRYKYNGNLSLSYRSVQRQQDDLTTTNTADYWVKWSHTPETRGSGRFSANVNAGSGSFNRNNSNSLRDFLAPTFNSNISYSKKFEGTPFNMSANVRHNQNTLTNIVNISPQANLTMNRIFPFKGKGTKKNVLTQLSFGYTGNMQGQITNDPQAGQARFPFSVVGSELQEGVEPDTVDFFGNIGQFVSDMDYGMTHQIPISTNLTLLKYFTMTPSVQYQEFWYPTRYNYSWVDSLNAVKVDTINQLSRAYQYSFSTGLNTRMYAFYFLKGGHAIRHMMTPNISYSMRPDFSEPEFDFYQEVQTNESGQSRRVPRFQGGQTPGSGRSSSIGFGLDNQFELKVKQRKDSTETDVKMPLLQNLSIRSSYNFEADSFNLANFSLSARTTIIKKFNINLSGTVDPYAYLPSEIDPETGEVLSLQRRNLFAWDQGQGVGRLTNASMNLSTSFSPSDFKRKSKGGNEEGQSESTGTAEEQATEILETENQLSDVEQAQLQDLSLSPHRYVDFNIPWSLNINYSLRYSQDAQGESRIVQTLSFNGELKLTEKWRLSANSGYDFEQKTLSMTTFQIFRDLHCWQMALSWVPFGQRQSYSIDISVKSSILQDLKVNKRNSWYDRAF